MATTNKPTKKVIEKAISSISKDEMSDIIAKLDNAKIQDLIQKINDKKEQISKKEYAVKISNDSFSALKNYILNDCEWSQTEALGVIEVYKVLEAIEKEGIKSGTIFIQALPLEAIHYFLSKTKNKGLQSAKDFMELWKPIDTALQSAKNDATEIKDLEKSLAAAQQGIELA